MYLYFIACHCHITSTQKKHKLKQFKEQNSCLFSNKKKKKWILGNKFKNKVRGKNWDLPVLWNWGQNWKECGCNEWKWRVSVKVYECAYVSSGIWQWKKITQRTWNSNLKVQQPFSLHKQRQTDTRVEFNVSAQLFVLVFLFLFSYPLHTF